MKSTRNVHKYRQVDERIKKSHTQNGTHVFDRHLCETKLMYSCRLCLVLSKNSHQFYRRQKFAQFRFIDCRPICLSSILLLFCRQRESEWQIEKRRKRAQNQTTARDFKAFLVSIYVRLRVIWFYMRFVCIWAFYYAYCFGKWVIGAALCFSFFSFILISSIGFKIFQAQAKTTKTMAKNCECEKDKHTHIWGRRKHTKWK